MTKPIDIQRAAMAKRAVLAKLEATEQQLSSMQQLLGAIVLRTGPLDFCTDELETMDPRRLVIVNIRDRWVVGLKDTGEQPLELTALRDRALADASEEASDAPG